MILTSYYTGHGHASITSAMTSALDTTDVKYKVVDMVDLCGFFLKKRCKAYGKTTTKRPWLWNIYYKFSHKFVGMTNWFVRRSIKKRFLAEVFEFRPDVIVSNHPMFVGSVLDIIKKSEIPTKFATVVADLVSINNLWLDARSDMIFLPTHEAMKIAEEKGLQENQIKQTTLPSRHIINEKAKTINFSQAPNNELVKCLVMSGGEGSGDLEGTIDTVISNKKTCVHAILGRNKILYDKLIEKYKDNHRVKIEGFVENIQEIIPTCDIAIVRGSPNVLMECINLLVPIITTSCLPGQEQNNDTWIYKNGFGLMCPDTSKLNETIDKYLADDRELLKQTRYNQFHYRDLNAASKTMSTIIEMANNKTYLERKFKDRNFKSSR